MKRKKKKKKKQQKTEEINVHMISIDRICFWDTIMIVQFFLSFYIYFIRSIYSQTFQ